MDNFFKKCPPKMEDGRFLQEFRSDTRVNEYIKYINKIYRDDDYRTFLQKNGDKILENEWKYLRNNNSCWENNCVHNYPTRVNPPWFVEERVKYDTRYVKSYPCEKHPDFRLTEK